MLNTKFAFTIHLTFFYAHAHTHTFVMMPKCICIFLIEKLHSVKVKNEAEKMMAGII